MTYTIPSTTNPHNFLPSCQAEVRIKRLPEICLMTQKTAVPGVSIKPATQQTPLVNIPQPGDTLYFDELPVEFLVDEDLRNWLSVFRWMKGLGFPDTTEEYAMLTNQKQFTGEGVFSDITQLLLNSQGNPRHRIQYRDCFPISLSEISLDVTRTETDYATARVIFMYRDYDIVTV